MFQTIKNICKDFYNVLNNNGDGHSLKKVLSVGYFVLCAYVTIKYTNLNNVVQILTILVGTLVSLLGINTYANYKIQQNGNLDITQSNQQTQK